MAHRVSSQFEKFFQERVGDHLRSVVEYNHDGFEVVYLREDVADLYSEEELAEAVDESKFESLAAPIYANAFAEEHGELECMVKCFESVIEMNFAISDGVGVAVALDSESMAESHGLVAEAREILLRERTTV